MHPFFWHGIAFCGRMFICSTVIYFDDSPVGYDLIKEDKGYLLKPASNHVDDFTPPLIRIVPVTEGWAIKGTTDLDVQAQARKLLELQALIDMPTLSAAS